ncbi:MAG: zf-HC2 domain-containing protein [Nitrospira sp.]|nr:zf-HC2 domain-containing protein [Nitrospira sp.]
MSRFHIPDPLTCQQVRQALPMHVKAQLDDPERQGRIEGHLRACETCQVALAETIEWLSDVSELPVQMPQPFPEAPVHVEVEQEEDRLTQALDEGIKSEEWNLNWRDRFIRWKETLKETVGPTVKLIKKVAQPVELITEGLKEMGLIPQNPSRRPYQFQLAGARTHGQIYVGESVLPQSGQPLVAISMHRNHLTINVRGVPLDQSPPLVMLIPLQHGAPPLIKELERPESSRTDLLAHFPNVGDQDYLLAIEPTDDPDRN